MTRHLIPILLFLAATAGAQTVRTVCASGCAYDLTHEGLQAAIDEANPYDVIEIEKNTTVTLTSGLGIVLRNKSITEGHITIRSSGVPELTPGQRVTPADAPKLARIAGSSGQPAMIQNEAGAAFYRFHGIEITADVNFVGDLVEFGLRSPTGGSLFDNSISDLAHDIIFDQCYIHADSASSGVRRGIRANLGSMTVINSWFDEFKRLPPVESNAIGGWAGTGPFYFRNNHFEAAGIITLFGGANPNIRGIRASGVWFIGNHYYKRWSLRSRDHAGNPSGTCLYDEYGGEYYRNTTSNTYWNCVSGAWTEISAGAYPPANFVKNLFELKNSWRTWVEGNYLENAWQPAHQNQYGAMFLLNMVDNHPPSGTSEAAATVGFAEFKNNYGRRTPWVASLGYIDSAADYFRPFGEITFDNNLFDEIGDPPYTLSMSEADGAKSGGGFMWFPPTATRIRYSHNTVNSNGSVESKAGLLFGSSSEQMDQAIVYGNIFPWGQGGLYNDSGGGALWNSLVFGLKPNRIFSRNVVVNNKSVSIYGRPSPVVNLAYNVDTPGAPTPCTASPFELNGSGPNMGGSCGFPANFSSGGTNDVGFVNYADRNYRLAANSRYKGWAHVGRDVGADVDVVEWSTSLTPSGTANPYLDFQVRTIIPSNDAVTMVYTAFDTTACSIEASTKPSFSAPVTVTDNGGDLDRQVTVNGLAPNTRYFWRVLCSGAAYRRQGVLHTNP